MVLYGKGSVLMGAGLAVLAVVVVVGAPCERRRVLATCHSNPGPFGDTCGHRPRRLMGQMFWSNVIISLSLVAKLCSQH